jgi:hypothetical protein
MADERDVPMWIKLFIGVVLFSIAIWGVAWAAGSGNSATASVLDSHEKRIFSTEGRVEKLDEKVTGMREMYIEQKATQKSLLSGQTEMKSHIAEQNKLMIEQIKSNAETKAWIKSIEKVD